MNKKTLAVVLCVVATFAGTLTLNTFPPTRGQASAGDQPPPDVKRGTREDPLPASAPDYVLYRQFFRHHSALKERAAEVERQGRSGQALRSYYKNKVGLEDRQANALDDVAAECDREVTRLDAEAKQIIDAARARYPNGVVPAGQSIPPAPPELRKMQVERNMIVMRACQQLREKLGAHGFQQVDDYLKLNFARNLQPSQLRSPQPIPSAELPGSSR